MMRNQQKYENLTYLALWSLLFIAPVLSLYIRTTTDSQLEFNWDEVLMVWRKLLFFLAVLLFGQKAFCLRYLTICDNTRQYQAMSGNIRQCPAISGAEDRFAGSAFCCLKSP